MELVNKLKELGLLGNELLHTSNGLEYITRNQLRKEIESALSRGGGRLALVSICPPTTLRCWLCQGPKHNVTRSSALVDRIKSEVLGSLHYHYSF